MRQAGEVYLSGTHATPFSQQPAQGSLSVFGPLTKETVVGTTLTALDVGMLRFSGELLYYVSVNFVFVLAHMIGFHHAVHLVWLAHDATSAQILGSSAFVIHVISNLLCCI